MKQLAPFIILLAILIIIAVVIISLFQYRLRKRLLDSGAPDENTIRFLDRLPGTASEALKWGLILFFGGSGLVIIEFIPFDPEHSALPFGIEMICIAVGFLIYYILMKRKP